MQRVTIEHPARYGKQLASHLSHKIQATETEAGWVLQIQYGEGHDLPRPKPLSKKFQRQMRKS